MRIAFVDSSSIRNPFSPPRALACWNKRWPGAQQKLEPANTLQPILEKLYQAQTLSQQESHQLFSAVVRGELKPEQLAAALVSMKISR
ncbi:anthranilate synthase component II [includes: glutamine amidotransferase; anthranilate phosphoribosyltransferase] [Escherichia coli]|uniref:Anthranilate synthase component II [includes: glutamine amidotransferase anthranilate phosphoribosyltransferase] n=1 Tax=Escherichia coli TaxID=562 RepID=A0A2X3K5N5_ECOLX|nr:anthranilate synthase component II [includes: glutamine amidotransferase; anthranilate phosphoribosyltransferase] [Escherichia coli]